MSETSLKVYYPWMKDEPETYHPRHSWDRQFYNYDFLKYEKKRIVDLQPWHKTFIKAGKNSKLQSASLYVVPVRLSSSWKAAIANYGDYNYVGLSALYNTPSVLLIGLIPRYITQPQDYRLIEIVSPKRVNLVNIRDNRVEPVVLIEDWSYLKSDSIYVDVPSEDKPIFKILRETLIDDDHLSLCLQSPIISAPFGVSVGGISLSSIHNESSFAKELGKTVQLMLPPEYRVLPPPKSAYNGQYFQYSDGVEFHLAERPLSDTNVVSSLYSTEYERVKMELGVRQNFKGEFSIFSAINPSPGNSTQVWKELWKNFAATEITLSGGSGEVQFLLDSGVDLRPLQKVINEDMWIQVACSRQCMPGISADIENALFKNINQLKEHYDVILSEIEKHDESRRFFIDKLTSQSKENIIRIAQSLARAEKKNKLDSDHLKDAKYIIIDNFTDLSAHPEINKIMLRLRRRKSTDNPRYSIIQTEIISNPRSSAAEIFEAVKSTNAFKDIYDVQKTLDWLHEKGFVILDTNKRYIWVGRYIS